MWRHKAARELLERSGWVQDPTRKILHLPCARAPEYFISQVPVKPAAVQPLADRFVRAGHAQNGSGGVLAASAGAPARSAAPSAGGVQGGMAGQDASYGQIPATPRKDRQSGRRTGRRSSSSSSLPPPSPFSPPSPSTATGVAEHLDFGASDGSSFGSGFGGGSFGGGSGFSFDDAGFGTSLAPKIDTKSKVGERGRGGAPQLQSGRSKERVAMIRGLSPMTLRLMESTLRESAGAKDGTSISTKSNKGAFVSLVWKNQNAKAIM